MRRGRENGLLLDDANDNDLVGINLGSDFCAEHEWGIKGLREMFGMKDNGYGLAKRKIMRMPTRQSFSQKKEVECVFFTDTDTETMLIVSNSYYPKCGIPSDLKRWPKDDALVTAWDEKSFGVSAVKADEREAVRQVYNAMQNNHLAIWLGGGGVFKNAGLVLVITHRVPKELAQKLHDADTDRERLERAALATGIEKKLEKAGKKWYALSPAWIAEGRKSESKYQVQFWLNPCDQQAHQYGWFTVEQLELWAKNEGPCMMSQEKKKA